MTPEEVVRQTCEILRSFSDPSVVHYLHTTLIDKDLKLVGIRARQCTNSLDHFLYTSSPKKKALTVREFKKEKSVGGLCTLVIKKALGVSLKAEDIEMFIH